MVGNNKFFVSFRAIIDRWAIYGHHGPLVFGDIYLSLSYLFFYDYVVITF